MIDQDLAADACAGDAVSAEHAFFDGLGVRHTHEDDIARLRDGRRRSSRHGAGRDNGRNALGLEIPDRQWPSLVEQAKRHRRAHQTETDKSEALLRHDLLTLARHAVVHAEQRLIAVAALAVRFGLQILAGDEGTTGQRHTQRKG
jgi:hypothetical protein